MGASRKRTKRFESNISIFLLAVLFLIAVGVFLKQLPQQKKDLSFLLPYGFKTLSEIEVYNVGNLYEKINGKASLYIEAGFRKLTTQRFVGQTDENLVMELYIFDMASTKNAFSVYSEQKRADVENLPGIEFAYKTTNAFYLVQGDYYIELIGFSESEVLSAAMTEVAEKIGSDSTFGKVTEIAELSLFPQEHLVPGSIKLYLASAFGFEGLTDTFTARYELHDETVTAFLSKRPHSKNSEVVAESYRNFLIENGATIKKAANKNLEGKVFDFYDMTEIVFVIGSFVAGIHEAENQKVAEELAMKLHSNLGEAAKTAKR